MDVFNPKEFADDLANQAVELLPDDLSETQNNDLVDKLREYTFMAGQALMAREEKCFDADACALISQIIAEWVFHKYIDLCRAQIPEEHIDPILQKICYEIYELATKLTIKNVETSEMLSKIEDRVKKIYRRSLFKLRKMNFITSVVAEKGVFLSNIDKMALEAQQENERKENENKIRSVFRFEVFIFFFSIFFAIYAYKFYPTDPIFLKSYCTFAFIALCAFVDNMTSKRNNK